MRAMRSCRPGLTLIELLIVSGLVVLVSTAVVGLSVTSTKFWSRDTAKTITDDEVSLALQNLLRRVGDGRTASVTSGVLSVTFPKKNAEGDYDRFQAGDTYTYRVENNNLYQVDSSGNRLLLGRNIISAQFGVSGATVTATLTSKRRWGTDVMQSETTGQVTLRNAP